MTDISPIGSPSSLSMPLSQPLGANKGQSSFTDFLKESIEQVNQMQLDADRAVETMVTGGDVNPAEVLTAVQKADLTFRLMMQLRNKALAAFEEVRNIRI